MPRFSGPEQKALILDTTSKTTRRWSDGLVIWCPKSRTPAVPNSDKCSIVLSANGCTHPPPVTLSPSSETQQSPTGPVGLACISGFHNRAPIAFAVAVTTGHPSHSQWTTPIRMLLAASKSHAGGRRPPVRRAKTRAAGPISALWEWDQDENHH